MAYCRLLARDSTPIVSRYGGDDYILTRHDECDYAVAVGREDAVGGVKKRRGRYKYPHKIRVGDRWILVHSLEEERAVLLAYRAELEAESAAVSALAKRAVEKKIVYTTNRLKALTAERAERKRARIRRTNNELMIIRSAMPWL